MTAAGRPQQCRDPAVAIATIFGRQRDNVGGERRIIGAPLRHLPLCRAMLPEDTAGKALRHLELLRDMLDASTAAGGAQKFPEAASRLNASL